MRQKLYFFFLLFTFSFIGYSQSYGSFATAVWITDCNTSNFFNTTGSGASLIGPPANDFNNKNFGVFQQNSGNLILRGGEVKTFKTVGSANVCGVNLFYRVYPVASPSGTFNAIDFPFFNDCNTAISEFPSGGPCGPGDQKWQRVIADDVTTPFSPVNLTTFTPNDYVLEVYYEIIGDSNSPSDCDDIVIENNNGNFFKAFFSIRSTPTFISSNPVTCGGSEGSITIGGLQPDTEYSFSFSDDGVAQPSVTSISNSQGEILISNLNAGTYANFSFITNNCPAFSGNNTILLSDPITQLAEVSVTQPTCSLFTGTIQITSPINTIPPPSDLFISEITDEATGSLTYIELYNATGTTKNLSDYKLKVYNNGNTFTSCVLNLNGTLANNSTYVVAIGSTNNVGGVVPNETFSSCAGINTNDNIRLTTANDVEIDIWGRNDGVNFTPNNEPGYTYRRITANVPSTTWDSNEWTAIDPQDYTNIGLHSFLTSGNQYEYSLDSITFQSNPQFSLLPPGNYTVFVKDLTTGCISLPLQVTINPVPDDITPIFNLPSTLCEGFTAPILPTVSDNGIIGNWEPETVSNTTTQDYVFTPDDGQCGVVITQTITIIERTDPTFEFGKNIFYCEGNLPDVELPNLSNNNISGSWNPPAIAGEGTYIFTPNETECATVFTLNVFQNPQPEIPLIIVEQPSCQNPLGSISVIFPVNNTNQFSIDGINFQFFPFFENLQPGSYTVFVKNSSECISQSDVIILNEVTPITPEFNLPSSICPLNEVPTLPTTSVNGIIGTWNPQVINPAVTKYTFTPDPNQCTNGDLEITITFETPINLTFNEIPIICQGETAPSLPQTSLEGILGNWNPETISNTQSGIYTFRPTSACANDFVLEVTVENGEIPVFNNLGPFCQTNTIPTVLFTLPTTSDNGILGSWSPSAIDLNEAGTISATFTPVSTCSAAINRDIVVTPRLEPIFTDIPLSICSDSDLLLPLPSVSSNGIQGSWEPSAINPLATTTYTFTPDTNVCASQTSITITVNNPFEVEIFETCENNSFILSTSILANTQIPNDYTYTWTNAAGAIIGEESTLNVTNYILLLSQSNIFPLPLTLTVNSSSNCAVVTNVVLDSAFCGIQKGISPNGDFLNDSFDLSLLNVKKLSIFNRYGLKVYSKDNYKNEWFGQSDNDKELPSATYYYVIEFQSGSPKTGWIYINREVGR